MQGKAKRQWGRKRGGGWGIQLVMLQQNAARGQGRLLKTKWQLGCSWSREGVGSREEGWCVFGGCVFFWRAES